MIFDNDVGTHATPSVPSGVNPCRFNEILAAAKKKDPSIDGAFLMDYLSKHPVVDQEIKIGSVATLSIAETIDLVHTDFVRDQKIPNTKCPAPMNVRRMI